MTAAWIGAGGVAARPEIVGSGWGGELCAPPRPQSPTDGSVPPWYYRVIDVT